MAFQSEEWQLSGNKLGKKSGKGLYGRWRSAFPSAVFQASWPLRAAGAGDHFRPPPAKPSGRGAKRHPKCRQMADKACRVCITFATVSNEDNLSIEAYTQGAWAHANPRNK